MIQLATLELPAPTTASLAGYQQAVDAVGTYAERVAAAKALFGRYNIRGNATFDEVKRGLDELCSGARRCAYCEDSVADEVEHVRPKDLYPEVVFAWANYIYACGPCNGPKGNHFAVFVAADAVAVEVARKPKDPVEPPPVGAPALIDPRTEDATRLMILDLRDTYRFHPLAAKGTRDHARAEYTIRTLHLNDRDALTRARRAAYIDYVSIVRRYQHDRDHAASPRQLAELVSHTRGRQHPTVWREMQRQHDKHPDLRDLFAAVPEARAW